MAGGARLGSSQSPTFNAASILTALFRSYRYEFIWFLVLLTVPLFFIQEPTRRLGAVAGKGLGRRLGRSHFHGGGRHRDLYRRVPRHRARPESVRDSSLHLPPHRVLGTALVSSFGVRTLGSSGSSSGIPRGRGRARGGHPPSRVLPYPLLAGSTSPSFFLLLAANAGAVVMPFILYFHPRRPPRSGPRCRSRASRPSSGPRQRG